MDRAHAAEAYTRKITQLVADLAGTGLEVSHPLLESREQTKSAALLVLSANRGLCGGYNSNLIRLGLSRWRELKAGVPECRLEVSGKRGINGFRFRGVRPHDTYTHFEDRPRFDEVDVLADRYLEEFITGGIDRLDVVYTRFVSSSRQVPTIETLLPLASLDEEGEGHGQQASGVEYEFLPSAQSILEEIVPASFKARLFKCFLDAAVSEQIARMVAMKNATENANDLIRSINQTYNRARQTKITSELLDVIGGVEALK
jgi:F-type H+-transporting ATPase subunit gamma